MRLESFVTDWPGKSAAGPEGVEHPAVYHMLDVAAVAERLTEPALFNPRLRAAVVLFSALHDLGKIGEPFRAMLREGVVQFHGRHWEVTEVLLRRHDDLLAPRLGGRKSRRWALYAACAGHHGGPPLREGRDLERMERATGQRAISDAREAITAFLALWVEARLDCLSREDALALSWWLPGLVAAADWIGSNPSWFKPVRPTMDCATYLDCARERAARAVSEAGLEHPTAADTVLFDFTPRPMQEAALEVGLPDGPALAVIEDGTGAGKTESALMLAQRMLLAGKGDGLFFALPTMATADAMFARVRKVVRKMFCDRPSLALAHGRAAISGEYRALVGEHRTESDGPVCSEWLADGQRRALLATVGVGTIDQAILSALPTRFATLRHYALAAKILIVDEAHELSEAYMAEELAALLRMHRRAGGSAIVLTATLPLRLRDALLDAYGVTAEVGRAYPALTVADASAGTVHDRRMPAWTSGQRGPVAVERLADTDEAIRVLVRKAGEGAACVWVRNAVDDAIAAVRKLKAVGLQADLLHARFALVDRLDCERRTLARFGPEGEDRAGRVLVATQVVESSLDLDFDVMVSDLAPMASLVQRAGRLWRHMEKRPRTSRFDRQPVLRVIAPDPATVEDTTWLERVLDRGHFVYPLEQQWRTADALFRAGELGGPEELRNLIEAVHGYELASVPDVLEDRELEGLGREMAEGNQARQNLVNQDEYYRTGGRSEDDREYPTRLGQMQRSLVLAKNDGFEVLTLWNAVDLWQLAEVRAAAVRLDRLDIPDQAAPKIARITVDWPDWLRERTSVCPVAPDGAICDGLRYDPCFGLLFEQI